MGTMIETSTGPVDVNHGGVGKTVLCGGMKGGRERRVTVAGRGS
jgi:hypothetical protein